MIQLLKREPAMLGAALSITLDGAALLAGVSSTAQGILHGITAAWIALGVRLLSTPTVKVAERETELKASARNEALADVASLAHPARREPLRADR